MEILGVIGIIVLVVLLFVFGGLFGWLLKGVGTIMEFLMEGFRSTIGCLIWVFIILLVLAAFAA